MQTERSLPIDIRRGLRKAIASALLGTGAEAKSSDEDRQAAHDTLRVLKVGATYFYAIQFSRITSTGALCQEVVKCIEQAAPMTS
jgi:hypothetical protein